MRAYDSHETRSGNSLHDWFKAKNPLLVAFNYLLISLAKPMPSLSLKRFLLRLTGMRIEKGAAVGLNAQFDVFFPELIELGEDCIIGFNATILAHEFLAKEYRTGKVRVGRKAVVGANSTVLCGVEIGENAVVGAGAVVTQSIPRNCFAAGVPAKTQKVKK